MQGNISNKILPPVNDPYGNDGKMFADIWLRYFNNLYQTLLTALQNGISVPSFTQSQIDSNPSLGQQVFVNNTTTNTLQIKIGSTWYNVTLTAV